MSTKNLFLIDGNSFCYRAYYAIKPLSNSKGQPTNAVFGFVTMLNKIVKDYEPDMLAVAFDVKGPTFRHKKFDDYKVHRKPMPDDLASQLPYIKEVVRAYRIPVYELAGYEADDVLATIAIRAADRGIDTFIITGDKDALQLVSDHIKVVNPHKEGLIYDREKVRERFKVWPEKMPDVMALMGDATDNIPGVSGIGEKTAVELISKYGSLEELIKRSDTIPQEGRKNLLRENEKIALLSKELALLDTNIPITVDFDGLKRAEPDTDRLASLFRELEFKHLLRAVAPSEKLGSKYSLITKEKEFRSLVATLKKKKEFAFDFETTSEEPIRAQLAGISFSYEVGTAYYVGVRSADDGDTVDADRKLDIGMVLDELRGLFEDASLRKIGQNIKYEYICLANYGIRLQGIAFDTMVASYVLNPSKLNHNLDDISIEYLNHRMTTPIESLIGKGKLAITMDKVPLDRVSEYSCEDADVTFRLKIRLEKELKSSKLEELFYDVEIPLIEVLATMEINGVAIDEGYLRDLSKELGVKLNTLTKEIYRLAKREFNINSPKQLAQVLFEDLKLPVVKKTKTGFSTDEDVLRRLAPKHPLPDTLLTYRELAKLQSTYVDALPDMVYAKTHKLHASFNQTVTATGRLSSSKPNLQNIPIKTEEGRKIRRAFVPYEKNDLILSADYSQIELRILAHLSGDKELIKAFQHGFDIHTYTASLVFGVKEKEVTAEMRGVAKTVNFGIVYGMSPYGLSQNLKIEVDKAKEFIDAYFERYPSVKEFLESMIDRARKKGYATTLMGRIRYIPDITSDDQRIRGFAERVAINTPIQGSAADIIKVAMISIHHELERKKLEAKMILQVHDELVFTVPKDELDEVAAIVRDRMEKVMKLKVPIDSHIEVGKNWLELQSYRKRGAE